MNKDLLDSIQGNPELMMFGLFQAASHRLGKKATHEEVVEYLQSRDEKERMQLSMEAARLVMEIMEKANVDVEANDDVDSDFFPDDIYEGRGKLECMPVTDLKKYTLRVKLNGISPSIWRKIEVPSSVKLTSLAEIILDAMGWWNEHLHQFVVKGRKEFYRTASKNDDDAWGRSYWGGDYPISHLLKSAKDSVLFEYDYGDGWEHTVTLSKIEDYADGEKPAVHLIGGKRACPPEDCGGVWGYSEMCESFKHPRSARAKELKEWLGYEFDPEDFDLDAAQMNVECYNSYMD